MPERMPGTGDERFRQLDRRWKETGDINDGAAYLRERIKRGDVKDSDAKMAALLGDPSALVIYRDVLPEIVDLRDWVEQIAEIGGLPIRMREARVIVNTIIENEGALGNVEQDTRQFVATMARLDQYLENPSKESVQAFIDSADSILGDIPRDTLGPLPTTGGVHAYMLLLRDLATFEVDVDAVSIVEMNPQEIIRSLVDLATNEDFGEGLSDDQIRQAIQQDLIPYLLGTSESNE